MAADFLQSNLCNPTAPSERFLKKSKWRKPKMDDGELRKLSRKGSYSRQESSGRMPSNVPAGSPYSSNNNYIFRNSSSGRGSAGISIINRNMESVHSGNRNVKNDIVISNHITQPMLSSVLSDGLVRIPGPPNHPRQVRSSNLKSSFTSRRERVRRSVSQNLPAEANLFAGPREVLSQETQFHDPCIQTHFQGQLSRQSHNTSDVKLTKNCVGNSELSGASLELNCARDATGCDGDNEILKKVLTTEDSSGHLDAVFDSSDQSPQQLTFTEMVNELNSMNDKKDILQVQTDLDRLNLTQDKICQSLTVETTEGLDTSPTKNKETETNEDLQSPDQPKIPNGVYLPRDSVEDYNNTSNCTTTKENNNPYSKRTSGKRKQHLLRLLHILFSLRWKRNAKKEDKMFLVEEDVTGEEGSGLQDHHHPTKRMKKKKMKERCKQSLTEHNKTIIVSKKTSSEGKEVRTTTSGSSSTTTQKKRRRPRKKNVYRAGRRIRKSLGYGCRYIGHGLANMTSIIPEVSYLGPVGHSRTFTTEYVRNTDYYDPNAPAWHYTKGPYIKNEYS